MTIRFLFKKSVISLRHYGIPSPELDAEIFLAAAIQKDKVFLLTHPEYNLSKKEEALFRIFLEKRRARMPVAYIIGKKEFFKLSFFVNSSVLVPRAETEHLVESVLEWLGAHPKALHIAEIGTGSGCIAVSIAKHAQYIKTLFATELSSRALVVAKKNIAHHALSKKITLKKTPLLNGIRKKFDCIVANLPYLSSQEYVDAVKNYPEIAYEPKMAHEGGSDGMKYINNLLSQVKKHLSPHGVLFLEIGALQGNSIKKLATTHIKHSNIDIKTDYCGFDRIAIIQLL